MENRSKTWDMANFAFLKLVPWFDNIFIKSWMYIYSQKPEKDNAINVVLENIAFQKLSLKICSCYSI